MAASASNSTTISLMPVSEKLIRTNHTVWKAQVLAVLRGAQLTGFLDGTIKASEKATDQEFKRREKKCQIQPLRHGRHMSSKS
jgi:hypothetical protein